MKGWAEADISQEDLEFLEKGIPIMLDFATEENGLKGVIIFRKNTCTEDESDEV